MSIIAQNNHGWFICCKEYFDSIYSTCVDEDKVYQYKIRSEFFNINTPFLMNSSALKRANCLQESKLPETSVIQDIKKKKQKKKKKKLPILFNSQVDSVVKTAATSLIELAHSINYLDKSDISSEEWFLNNVGAREIAKMVTPLSFEGQIVSHENHCDSSALSSYMREEYILPARATFHLSDVKDLHMIKDKFDLILIDPPWKNKSVRRKKGYYTLDLDALLDLSIVKLCNPGCLVVVWVTNKNKQVSFVEKELFQKWNITTSAIWHWVKVTKKGHFVFPIDSQQKKPYENLLLGYVDSGEGKHISHSKDLQPHKTIVSVPSSIHSNKPPLVEILQPYLPKNPHCLEIFARYLLPGWTSIGNEVIKLQNTKLFERVPNH